MTNRNVLSLLIVAVSVVGLSMGATLPLVSQRLHEAGGSSLAIGVVSAMPAAGMILALILIGQDIRGADLVTANASVVMLWGIGSLLGPLLSGAMMAGTRMAYRSH